MQIIAEAGLVEWSGGRVARFADVDSAGYLGGLWLEEYARHTAVALGSGFCPRGLGWPSTCWGVHAKSVELVGEIIPV